MPEMPANQPLEIFGYPLDNRTQAAENARGRHFCRFRDGECVKKSRLIKDPFGVCSAVHGGEFHAICPHRFEERGSIAGVSKILEDVARHCFGNFDNTIAFSEVRLPGIGNIDYVLVRHKPLKPEVEDFVSVEIQSNSTTDTGGLVQGMKSFLDDRDLSNTSYKFGMNTYDSIKRAMTQLMNKGVVYESWNTKCYWVIQEYFYKNLVGRYGFKTSGYSPSDSSRFALYKLVRESDCLTLKLSRFISTTVDEVYEAIRKNPAMPKKDAFVQGLNARLRLELRVGRG